MNEKEIKLQKIKEKLQASFENLMKSFEADETNGICTSEIEEKLQYQNMYLHELHMIIWEE